PRTSTQTSATQRWRRRGPRRSLRSAASSSGSTTSGSSRRTGRVGDSPRTGSWSRLARRKSATGGLRSCWSGPGRPMARPTRACRTFRGLP
ncbi:hypothetical protein IWQ56_001450, partial [Coemansia nantahalensis]